MQKIKAFFIDFQEDFCNPKTGTLYVPGAEDDAQRAAQLIKRIGHKLDDIICTLDSHHPMHIANAVFWKKSDGSSPAPFTQITSKDVENGTYTPKIPGLYKHCLEYTRHIEANGRYTLMTWPSHCLISSVNHALVPDLFNVIRSWEEEFLAIADMVTKGSNYKTEHYSALRSEWIDSSDSSTSLNVNLIKALETSDTVLIAGQALSHCVANTIYDLVDSFADKSFIKKLVLLKDCTSNVPGFEALGEKFVKEMTALGMQITTSDKFLV